MKFKKIFLSASVPVEGRGEEFLVNLDVVAIKDAVKSLAMLLPGKCKLVWGGHPSITPIIADTLANFNCNANDYVTMYQSNYFPKEDRPIENEKFGNVINTKVVFDKYGKKDRNRSLLLMRREMINACDYDAAIFIGGMNGVFEEYDEFKKTHPHAKIIPVPTTGGAAKILYEKYPEEFDPYLKNNYAYFMLFKKILDLVI